MDKDQEYWAARVNEYHKSGESLRGWCDRTGIKRSSMRYWIERLDEISCDDGIVRFARLFLKDEAGDKNDI